MCRRYIGGLFWVPAGIGAVMATVMALTVKETPEEAGFHRYAAAEPRAARSDRLLTA